MQIGILQTGPVADQLAPTFGQYGDIFARYLGGRGLNFRVYDVCAMDLPETPSECDGWLITGSRFGAYEDHPWIPPLENFIRAAHAAKSPMIGVCFGHQIIAQALGGRVEKFAGGWSVGRVEYRFSDGRTLPLFAWHQDQVIDLPEGAEVTASTDFCAIAGFVVGDHIMTIQPHPEFTPDYLRGIIEHRSRGIVPDDQRAAAQASADQPVAGAAMADAFEAFFRKHAEVADAV